MSGLGLTQWRRTAAAADIAAKGRPAVTFRADWGGAMVGVQIYVNGGVSEGVEVFVAHEGGHHVTCKLAPDAARNLVTELHKCIEALSLESLA